MSFIKLVIAYFGAPGKWSLLIKSGLQSISWQKETFSTNTFQSGQTVKTVFLNRNDIPIKPLDYDEVTIKKVPTLRPKYDVSLADACCVCAFPLFVLSNSSELLRISKTQNKKQNTETHF